MSDATIIAVVCVAISLLSGAAVLYMAAKLGEERAMRMFWRDECRRMLMMGGRHD